MQSHRLPGSRLSLKNATGSLSAIAVLLLIFASLVSAQRGRINGPIDNSRRVALSGHVNPRARAEYDQGRVDPSQVLPYVSLIVKQTAQQQADLEQLLAEQQDPSSPNYHKWLTPEQYADRFGASQDDLNQVAAWLQQQNLTVVGTARGRNWIAFRGTAGQIESAFGTPIHHYQINGELHYANATDPTIPAALQNLVGSIHGLTDFRMRARLTRKEVLKPNYNSSRGSHFLAPEDVATIYDVRPLYGAGIDGTGQSIVVVGQTNIKLSDIELYRTFFNLPSNDPTLKLVTGQPDPGIVSGDEDEADLDLEFAGGIAPNAKIFYVYSGDVEVSAQYAVDQNLAPILSMSYGLCEALTGTADARNQRSLAQQASAQGITWIAASGDSGAADCVDPTLRTNYGLQVDVPSAIPEVTGVGGTTLFENGGNYWASTNDSNHASAISYIPEVVWNDSVQDGSPSSSGGGASTFFAKPSWQTGDGVPSDGARDVPDISLSGSADHDGYLMYSQGAQSVVGGTSVGAPTFSGIIALVSQYLASKGISTQGGLGNINPKLYALAASSPSVFHDVVNGDNKVDPCPGRAPRTCDPTTIGYAAGPGYDLATGWGSVDAYNLAVSWLGSGNAISKGSVTLSLSSSDLAIPSNVSLTLTATLKAANGGSPTGTVTFTSGIVALGTANVSGGTATIAVNGSQLALGSNSVSAQYSGDSSYNGASGSISITVATPSTGTPSITSASNGASFKASYAPGMIVSVFGSQLAAVTGSAQTVPLPAKLGGVSVAINGVTAPLYYVSPTQLNVQIPYETPVNSNVQLTVTNNGQTASTTLRLAAAAPGIFVDSNGAPVPNTSATRGSIVSLYITGDGAVTPALATGASPSASTALSNLPKPTQSTTVTIGGVSATIDFIGIPPGLAGVTQINYLVPANAPTGAQPVIVTVGSVPSAAATLTVR